ncbi:MAG: YcgL domain-containing protein [bacterium]
MQCFVYRSSRKPDMYIYMKEKDCFDDIPEALMTAFGTPEFALEFELTPERKLAREDAEQVLKNIHENGFHLQMPPEKEEMM